MRITHSMIADTVNYNLQGSLRRLERYSNQLSTGKLFSRPSENPVGVGRVMSYSMSVSRNEQFRLNMNQSRGWLDNTEYSLQNGLDVLQRIRELSIYGANESLTTEDRRAIAPEVLEFIDHLIGVANTEVNGLYIFGGHQTLNTPFIREKLYRVDVGEAQNTYMETYHVGSAHFETGAIQGDDGAGTLGEPITLRFTLGGQNYEVTALTGATAAGTAAAIRAEIEADPDLSALIEVDDYAGGTALTFTKRGLYDFTVRAVSAEAWTVIANLEENVPVYVTATEHNIGALTGTVPESFFAGEYRVLTDKTTAPYLAGYAGYEYSLSGDPLLQSVVVDSAPMNQSAALTVTAVNGDLITIGYDYYQVDPSTGDTSTGRGTFTVDRSAAFTETIGGVTFTITMDGASSIAAGDKIVINTNADLSDPAEEAKLIHLHSGGSVDPLFTYAFSADFLPLIEGGDPRLFSFYSLDPASGELRLSTLGLQWPGTFETADDLASPAAGFTIATGEGGGILIDDDNPISAEGLLNGSYRLEQEGQTALSDQNGTFEIVQQYLQGSAESIFVRLVGENEDIQVTARGDYSASVLLEVNGVDHDPSSAGYGTISYAYRVHRYDLGGAYSGSQGEFTLRAGGAADQTVDLHGVELTFSGLDLVDPALAVGLKSGDRAVLNIQPSLENGTSYDLARICGEHRAISGENGRFESAAAYTFREGALDGQKIDFRYYSLDNYYRSPDRGTVYDGRISLSYDEFLPAAGSALTFSYDRNGFPVYRGDYHDRIQEISPFQELIMNLSGDKAFGLDQEVFEAVFEVYWALVDNDRETLGGEALLLMDRAVDHFLEKLAQVGARSNRLEAMHSTLDNQNLYLREVRSNIEDIDLAEKVTEFMMQENAYQAALSTASMMLQPSLVDYWR